MSFSGSSGLAAALASTGQAAKNIISPPRPEAAPVSTLDLAAHHLFSAGLNLFKGLTSCGGQNAYLSYGAAHTIGRRGYMEDRFVAEINFGAAETKQSLFGVFDGHGGELAAQYCTDNIPVHIRASKVLQTDPAATLTQAFERTDQDFCTLASAEFLDDGSTAVVALIRDNVVYCANAGDSRCILSRGAIAIPLSEDHKPNRPDERQRINELGGFVKFLGVWRTQGILAVSRAIGDLSLKKFVIPTPDIVRLELTDKDEFIVLASDGVWDAMTNQEVVDMLHSRPNLMIKPELAARAIVTESFRRGSFDNITAVVVSLKPPIVDPTDEASSTPGKSASSRRRKSTRGGKSIESISEVPEFAAPEQVNKRVSSDEKSRETGTDKGLVEELSSDPQDLILSIPSTLDHSYSLNAATQVQQGGEGSSIENTPPTQ